MRQRGCCRSKCAVCKAEFCQQDIQLRPQKVTPPKKARSKTKKPTIDEPPC
jgi:hypothetical protein